MPAIQLKKLRGDIRKISESFFEPDQFVRHINRLFETTADRTYRPGQSAETRYTVDAYNIPLPILREIAQELGSFVKSHPMESLNVCDKLFEQPYFESRLLAIYLLGKVDVSYKQALEIRFRNWAVELFDERLISALIYQGARNLRSVLPGEYLELVFTWLKSEKTYVQRIGLRALIPMLAEEKYNNLPRIYNEIMPLMRTVRAEATPELIDVLLALVNQSPVETAHFFQQALIAPLGSQTTIIIRKAAARLPGYLEEEIKGLLRNRVRTSSDERASG